MKVISKFVLRSVTQFTESGEGIKKYALSAICDNKTPENQKFQKYTPNGNIELHVDNPEVNFKIGKSYYVTFEEADD